MSTLSAKLLGSAYLIADEAPSISDVRARLAEQGLSVTYLPRSHDLSAHLANAAHPELVVLALGQANEAIVAQIKQLLPVSEIVLLAEEASPHVLEAAETLGLYFVLASSDARASAHWALTLRAACQRVALRREHERLASRAQHETFHDPLTGLANGALLRQRLEVTHHGRPREAADACAVLFINVDRYKNVNDSLGHHVGDSLLQRTAGRLLGTVRPTDLVARLTGDEFCVLLEGIEDRQDVRRAAERVQKALVAPVELQGQEVFVSVSIGIAMSRESGASARHLVRDAGTAMHRAKNKGGGVYEIFDLKMQDQAAVALQLENRLRRAVSRGEFVVYYQPIVSLTTGEVMGFEALVRWQSPELGLVQPTTFIPIAEQTGLIVPIGRHVLSTACRQLAVWNAGRSDQEAVFVSVNISPRQFHHEELEADILRIVEETGAQIAHLKLEVTESMLIDNMDGSKALMERLCALGLRLCIDDFGTGYSSLSTLHALPIHTLKVDRTFVREMGEDPRQTAIADTIISLAHTLGMEVIAEGIETFGQHEALRIKRCAYGQGYFFSRPVDAAGATVLLNASAAQLARQAQDALQQGGQGT